jgi:hypothetical protein
MGSIKETFDAIRSTAGKATPAALALLMILATVGGSGWLLYYFVTGISRVAKDQTDTVSSIVKLQKTIIEDISTNLKTVTDSERRASAAETERDTLKDADKRLRTAIDELSQAKVELGKATVELATLRARHQTMRDAGLSLLNEMPQYSPLSGRETLNLFAREVASFPEMLALFEDPARAQAATKVLAAWVAASGLPATAASLSRDTARARIIETSPTSGPNRSVLVCDSVTPEGVIARGILLNVPYGPSEARVSIVSRVALLKNPMPMDPFGNELQLTFIDASGAGVADFISYYSSAPGPSQPTAIGQPANRMMLQPRDMDTWLAEFAPDAPVYSAFREPLELIKARRRFVPSSIALTPPPDQPAFDAEGCRQLLASLATLTLTSDALAESLAQDSFTTRQNLGRLATDLCLTPVSVTAKSESAEHASLTILPASAQVGKFESMLQLRRADGRWLIQSCTRTN